MSLTCGQCGGDLPPTATSSDGTPLWYENDEVKCPGCEAVNIVNVDPDECLEDVESEEGDPIGTAYVHKWICKHGVDEDTECASCETT